MSTAPRRQPRPRGAFSPASDFTVAIDFDLLFQASGNVGGLAIGFGIGEDSDGMNSAGAVLLSQNGSLSPFFGGAARVNDVTQIPKIIPLGAQSSGSFFASYEASSGDVTLGVGASGAGAPSATATFTGIANQWSGEALFPAFFLRSDDVLGDAWTAGSADATFSNFRVLSGTPKVIPEPGSLILLLTGALVLGSTRFRNVIT